MQIGDHDIKPWVVRSVEIDSRNGLVTIELNEGSGKTYTEVGATAYGLVEFLEAVLSEWHDVAAVREAELKGLIVEIQAHQSQSHQ